MQSVECEVKEDGEEDVAANQRHGTEEVHSEDLPPPQDKKKQINYSTFGAFLTYFLNYFI